MEFRTRLRSNVSSHLCRVRLPWFSDGGAGYSRFRREVTYAIPRPSIMMRFMCGLTWIALSLYRSACMVRKHGLAVYRQEGINPARQFCHMVLRAIRTNHSPLSYHSCRIYRRGLFSREEEAIPSIEMRLFYDRIYGRVDSDLIDQKGRFHDFCRTHGIPTAPILAVATGDEVKGIGGNGEHLPRRDLFSKPLNSFLGDGAMLWEYDPASDRWRSGVELLNEKELLAHLNELALRQRVGTSDKYHQILQARMVNHPAIAGGSTRSLNTIRVYTICRRGGQPEVAIAHLRMAADDSIIDTKNFYAASIGLETGTLGKAISPDPLVGETDVHPLTGKAITGVVIPEWNLIQEIVLKAHRLAPPHAMVGWDVASTPEGPLLMEGNTCGQIDASQLSNGISFAQERFVDVLLSWLPEEEASDRDQDLTENEAPEELVCV